MKVNYEQIHVYRKLYWGEQGGNSAIFVSDLIGRDMGILVEEDIVNPRGIAIDYKLDMLVIICYVPYPIIES